MVNEHHCHVRLYHTEKSALTEHIVDLAHRILLHNTSILANDSRRRDRLTTEGIEIGLHPNYMNEEDGLTQIRP
jgi:hypothetical protein